MGSHSSSHCGKEIVTDFCNAWIVYTHQFNGSLSGTIQVSRYQKGKTNLDFTVARDSEWQWHQLGYMQVCTSLQTETTMPAPHHSVFTARCYAFAVLAMGLCLSVCQSQAGVLLKRQNVGSHKQHHTLVFWSQRSQRNSTGVTPYKGARWGGSKSATFDK